MKNTWKILSVGPEKDEEDQLNLLVMKKYYMESRRAELHCRQ
jgi:hypothetical protein